MLIHRPMDSDKKRRKVADYETEEARKKVRRGKNIPFNLCEKHYGGGKTRLSSVNYALAAKLFYQFMDRIY